MASYIIWRSGEESNETDSDAEVEGAPFVPPMIDDDRVCGWWYALDTCVLYGRVGVSSVLILLFF